MKWITTAVLTVALSFDASALGPDGHGKAEARVAGELSAGRMDRRQEVAGPAVALRPLLDRTPRDPRLPGDLSDRKLPRSSRSP